MLPRQAADLARDYFKDAPNVFVEDSIPINDGWTRDWGPTVRLVDVASHCCVFMTLGRWQDLWFLIAYA